MTPEQEKMLRGWVERGGYVDDGLYPEREAVAALLAERDRLKEFVGECTPDMLDGKTAFSRYYDMLDRREKAEAERDAARKEVERCNEWRKEALDLIEETRHDLEDMRAMYFEVSEQREAALAKLGAVSEAWKWVKHDESPHADDINAALASTPEIVAVVDGSVMAASGGSTHWHEFRAAVDLPHGDYRAIIVRRAE